MNNLLDSTGRPLSADLCRAIDNAGPGGCGLFVARFFTEEATAFAVGIWFNKLLSMPPSYRQTGCNRRVVATLYLKDRHELAPLLATLAAAAAPSLCAPPGPGLAGAGCFADPWPVLAALPAGAYRCGPAVVQGAAPASPHRPEPPARRGARRQLAKAESVRACLDEVPATATVRVGVPLGPGQQAIWLRLPVAVVRAAAEQYLDEQVAQAKAQLSTL